SDRRGRVSPTWGVLMPGAAHGTAVRIASYALRSLLFMAGAIAAYLLLSLLDRPAHADPGRPAPPAIQRPDLGIPVPHLTLPAAPKSPPLKSPPLKSPPVEPPAIPA